jgi:hypothetical protein
MQTTGSVSVSSSANQVIPLTILNPDPANLSIRANNVAYTVSIPEGYNGLLKFYDISYDSSGSVPFWLSPIRQYNIVDGLFNGENSISDSYSTYLGAQEVWSIVSMEDSAVPLTVNYTLTFPYPAVLPSDGYWLAYVDPATGYNLPLIKFTADGKIDLNGKTLINQGS